MDIFLTDKLFSDWDWVSDQAWHTTLFLSINPKKNAFYANFVFLGNRGDGLYSFSHGWNEHHQQKNKRETENPQVIWGSREIGN